MLAKPWFEEWFSSPYYHLLYNRRDNKEANEFIAGLIQHLEPLNGNKMLDVACGRGRHSKALAEMGFDVTGIDLSLASIQEAQKYERENLQFFQHDMRLPFWIHYFNYAFNFFTSFGYFNTLREHDNAIRTIAQSLTTSGVFVIDYLNVHFAEDHLVEKESKTIDDVQFEIKRWQTEEHFYKKVVIIHQDAEQTFTEKVSKFSLGDFNDMFAYQGLQIQEVYGDYNFADYNIRTSPRLIMIAKKIKP